MPNQTRPPMALLASVAAAVLGFAIHQPGAAAGETGPHADLVPQFLLGLVHAPEVHQELNLTSEQVAGLEVLFAETDAAWFPARNLAPDRQREVIDKLETRVRQWFAENTTADQQSRLRQLEFYAQGNRILLRQDVAKEVGLSVTAQQKLADLARASHVAQQKLARTKFGDDGIEALQTEVARTAKDEQAALAKIVQQDQRTKLAKILGERFDPTRLARIYAMAPDFAADEAWINSPALSLKELRGKVVLVHFYAFQCHNCHANFDIYRRWHEKYSSDDVVLIGIQTPETSRERDADAVIAAAEEKQLDFPIQIDLQSQTWKAWGNTMWPTVYVVDQDGYVRHWWSGELNWKGATADQTIEKVVDQLLSQN
ncbi:Thiol-disulfide oxidoreductase YkuV [Rubripirellula lacrimiformis]|uniref:Thiol-disulfide oxidoreductase YkuV n=1 Tax=Rubripirellula lacrimiformis TaxID=1930273 RepID=A0A517NBX8_9BACT|nr:redoxin domain-containing protein [Rubripirellula lacrimiformis]QDT04611.1 Thiol-disulfide oxidoreductase YkuV [Rubripirellula lacrimiformis]